MIHAFSPEGLRRLASVLESGPLLAFDIDGTLAPIVQRPDDARLPEEVQQALARLSQRAPVAVVTGRARADAKRMLEFEPAYIVGNHGSEGVPGWEQRAHHSIDIVRAWKVALERSVEIDQAGVWIEDKRFSLSLHYRGAAANAEQIAYREARQLVPAPHLIGGKAVLNILPPDAPHKGHALEALLEHSGRPVAIYVGDDETDEAVFRMPHRNMVGVRVEPHAQTAAELFVPRQHDVPALIDLIAQQWQMPSAADR